MSIALPLNAAHDTGQPIAVTLGLVETEIMRPGAKQAIASRRQMMVVARDQHLIPELHLCPLIVERLHALHFEEIGAAKKLRGKAVRRIAKQRLGIAEGTELSIAHDADMIGERQCFRLVMRDIEHGQRRQLAMQPGELIDHRAADLCIECGQRLIKQEHLRADRDGASDRDALLLAAGELARIALRVGGHADHGQGFRDAGANNLFRHAPGPQSEGDILLDPHMRKERIVLHHHADIAVIGCEVGDVAVADHDAAARGAYKARHGAQRRRLSRTGRADQGDDLARIDGQVQRVENGKAIIGNRDILEGDPLG